MRNSGSVTRPGVAVFAALVGLAALAAPVARAIADGGEVARVTVVNPATSPVPTTVNNTAAIPALTSNIDNLRVPYQSVAAATSTCAGASTCNVAFGTVPTGQRLVVQQVSGSISINVASTTATSVTAIVSILNPSNLSVIASFFIPVQIGIRSTTTSTNFDSEFVSPVLAFIDGGTVTTAVTPTVSASVSSVSGTATFGTAQITVTGNLINCSTAIPCAAIAQ